MSNEGQEFRQPTAVTNARFAALHGLPVAPSPSRRRPLRFSNRALVTSEHPHCAARAASFRLRLGGGRCAPAPIRLNASLRPPLHFPRSPTADRSKVLSLRLAMCGLAKSQKRWPRHARHISSPAASALLKSFLGRTVFVLLRSLKSSQLKI